MKKCIILIPALMLNLSVLAQNSVQRVLELVERNNTTLKAVRQQLEADKAGNRTGLFPHNPEAEFAYLWGSPTDLGNRTNVSLVQSFDFPSSYIHRSKIAGLRNNQLEAGYAVYRAEILLEARMLCIDLVYYHTMINQIRDRLKHTESIAHAYANMFDKGEAGLLEYNKAQLELARLSKQLSLTELERQALLGELQRLNGGEAIEANLDTYITPGLPADAALFVQTASRNNPGLIWLDQEKQVMLREVQLNKSLNLPGISAGYVSEALAHEQFQGVVVGLSIPLWERRHVVKQSQLQSIAAGIRQEDEQLQFTQKLKTEYQRAASLENTLAFYRSTLERADHTRELRKALETGHISLVEYFQELSFFYQGIDEMMDTERELNRTLAWLLQYY